MNKGLQYFWVLILCATVSCSSSKNPIEFPDIDEENPGGVTETNLVSNYDFEKDIDLAISSTAVGEKWSYIGGWNETKAKVEQLDNRGVNNSRCLAIIALTDDVDVKVAQKITGLKANTPYRITARVKTENVTNGKGAHLSLDYLWAPTSEGIVGTQNWTTVSLDIDEAPQSGEITLCLRLGNTSAASRGVAYFDNIVVKENTNLYIRESDHVKIVVEKSNVSVSDAVIDKWLGNLDKVYLSYKEFFNGRVPFGGRKMLVRQMNGIPAWAYAGEPIQWNGDYISSELLSLNQGNWSFGIMHEIGHNFASHIGNGNRSWNWDEELFANFRMYYALDKLEGAALMTASVPDGKGGYTNVEKLYRGTEIQDLYKSESTYCYDRTLGANLTDIRGESMIWTLIRIQEKYGWDIFMKAFDEIYKLPPNSVEENTWSSWQRFEYFLTFLSKYAGEDVRSTYTQNELNLIKIALGG